jgi:GTP-binding protein
MKIRSAEFLKALVDRDEILENGIPQVAFIGRSNVGKSSVINLIAQKKELARSSPTPGHTRTINVFYINKDFYLVDLPGYGFAKGSWVDRQKLKTLIEWYLIGSGIDHKLVVVIIDANVGVTEMDDRILSELEEAGKKVIVLANKIDKIKKSEYVKKMKQIAEIVAPHKVIPFSAEKKIGLTELTQELI